MLRKSLWSTLIALWLLPAFAQQDHQPSFDGKTWWEHIKVLAADDMEGRDTGSPGLKRAEAYTVKQLKAEGLQPAGARGFYQPVKFESRQLVETESSAALVRDGKAEPLTLGEDAIFSTRVDLAPAVEAPLVFVGYGLSIPESNFDELAGIDLKGKVAVLITGSPEQISSALASHHQTAGERWKAFREAGAVGIITIPNSASMDVPWSRIALNRLHPAMDLAGAEFNETQGEKLALAFEHARHPVAHRVERFRRTAYVVGAVDAQSRCGAAAGNFIGSVSECRERTRHPPGKPCRGDAGQNRSERGRDQNIGRGGGRRWAVETRP